MSNSVRPHRRQPTRLPCAWDSPGKNTGVGCHFLLQCMKVKSESEVTQSCPTLHDPMDCSPPGSSVCGIFQARVLEWGAIAFSTFPRDPHLIHLQVLSIVLSKYIWNANISHLHCHCPCPNYYCFFLDYFNSLSLFPLLLTSLQCLAAKQQPEKSC